MREFLKNNLAKVIVGSAASLMMLASIFKIFHFYNALFPDRPLEVYAFCAAIGLATVGAMGVMPMINRISETARQIAWTGVIYVFCVEALFNVIDTIYSLITSVEGYDLPTGADNAAMATFSVITFDMIEPLPATIIFSIMLGVTIPLVAIGYMKAFSEMYKVDLPKEDRSIVEFTVKDPVSNGDRVVVDERGDVTPEPSNVRGMREKMEKSGIDLPDIEKQAVEEQEKYLIPTDEAQRTLDELNGSGSPFPIENTGGGEAG